MPRSGAIKPFGRGVYARSTNEPRPSPHLNLPSITIELPLLASGRGLTFNRLRQSKRQLRLHLSTLDFRGARSTMHSWECAGILGLSRYVPETRHKLPWAFTIQQGLIPTQLCCGTTTLGGTRRTRMKESHEV